VPGLSPFSASDSAATMGMTSLVYEPLIMFNAIRPTEIKPWLASKYAWSNNGKRLTFTIPAGRRWSDGKPLTADDIAYTFGLIKKNSALNVAGVVFKSAAAPSPTRATITFSSPAYTQLFAISKVLIVPKHIWSGIAKPEKFANEHPVGSGPYLLDSITPQAMTFTKNNRYWRPGVPKVETVRVPNYTSQNAALNALSAGKLDWSTLFIANPEQQWFSKDREHNKLWLVPAGDWFLCPNNTVKPFDNAAVRGALALTIDRAKTIPQVENGFYAPATSPTGLRAGQEQYLPSAYKGKTLSYDPAAARKAFLAAGLQGGSSGGLKLADGSPFKLALMLPSEYTDWMSLGQVLVNQMRAAGIDARLQGVSVSSWTNNVASGAYDVSFCGVWSTDSPYTTYNTLLNSSATAPVGKAALSNVVRWRDARTDKLLASYRSTGDRGKQVAAIQGLASIVAREAPIIPLMSVTSFGQYTTKRFTGFPSAANPYQTDSIIAPWTLDVVLHLTPAP